MALTVAPNVARRPAIRPRRRLDRQVRAHPALTGEDIAGVEFRGRQGIREIEDRANLTRDQFQPTASTGADRAIKRQRDTGTSRAFEQRFTPRDLERPSGAGHRDHVPCWGSKPVYQPLQDHVMRSSFIHFGSVMARSVHAL